MKMKLALDKQGFGLIKSLVTLGLLIIALGSVYSLFAYNQKAASVQNQVLELNQAIIASTELFGREARSAGLKVSLNQDITAGPVGALGVVAPLIPSSFLPASPAPLTVTLNTNDYPIKLTPGVGSNPDAVTLIGAIGEKTNPTKVAVVGDTTLTLNLTADQTQARYTVGDLIYFGEQVKNAKITSITGNQLTIDPPLKPAQWTEVGKLSVISYEIFTNNGLKCLQRKENSGNFEVVAEGVVDLQATQVVENGKPITTIRLTAQTAKPDLTYQPNGGFRQKTFTIQVSPKNI